MTTSVSRISRRSCFAACVLAITGLAWGWATSGRSVSAQSATPNAKSAPAVSVKLTENGRASLPIVISAQAGEREKAAAQTLADYLKRISGGDFKVETATAPLTTTTPGIVLSTLARLAGAPGDLKADDATKQEDYLLRSHASGVLLIGASDLALEHAVWDFLYRLGYRQFFPGAIWEIVPQEKNLSIAVNDLEHPDYYSRIIRFNYGTVPENRESYLAWNARNRLTAGIELSTGHSYDAIIRRHQAEFKAHPEYLAKPGGSKFCVSNPGLQKLVIEDSLARFAENPDLQSISLEPSDGGGWQSDSCDDAKVYKNITDRAVTLANVVAEAVTKKYPDKYIGMYAYNEHSPPPTIPVNPHVVVSIATSFIHGGYTMDGLLDGWSQKASLLGIREYYSINTWSHDLPGRARGGNLDYLEKTIVNFHAKKAHFLNAESGDNWGPNGLGYYIASRLLWHTAEIGQVEALKNDFFTRAFGPAREPMVEFYRLLDGSNKPLLSADLIGRLYRQLDKGWHSTGDAATRARLHDLALYVRYVELFSAYSQADGAARQAAFEDMMRFAWRIRATHMVHSYALWRDLHKRDKRVQIPAEADFKIPEPKNPWKSSEPFTDEDVQKFIADGIANNKVLAFAPVEFSKELVPAGALHLVSGKPGKFSVLRGTQDFYTWVSTAPATISLQASGGQVHTTHGNAKLALYPAGGADAQPVAQQEVPPDKQVHDVQLKAISPGLYRINVKDGSGGTSVAWPEGMPMTVESSLTTPARFADGRWTMYFYVPKGTKTIGGSHNGGAGGVLDGTGKKVLDFADQNDSYWSVPVAPGQDGKLWTLASVKGPVGLMTVPPYLARSAAELLLPKEVVAADAVKQ